MKAVRPIANAMRKRRHTPAAPHTHDSHCSNCATPLTGKFCHACGQSAHVHHSLLHLIEEVMHGLWHFDAKGWRTFPLLIVRPGELTRRFIDGQRVRFFSPLPLFFFMVFLMFFVLSHATHHPDLMTEIDKGEKATKQVREKLQNELVKSQLALQQLQTLQRSASAAHSTSLDPDLPTKISDAEKSVRTASTDLSEFDQTIQDSVDLKNDFFDSKLSISNNTGMPFFDNAITHFKENQDLVFYKLKNNAYQFALLLVPLSMPFLWLVFFWRRNVSMFDHAVFSLYSLSFMALLITTIALLSLLKLTSISVALILLAPPLHMFRQLRGTYRLSWASALWRTAFLLIVASIMLVLFFLFVASVSLS